MNAKQLAEERAVIAGHKIYASEYNLSAAGFSLRPSEIAPIILSETALAEAYACVKRFRLHVEGVFLADKCHCEVCEAIRIDRDTLAAFDDKIKGTK